MGISKDAVKLLIHEAKREPFKGNALMLGKQNVRITQKELELIAKRFQFHLSDKPMGDTLSTDPGLRSRGCISDNSLFVQLGFSDCKAIDYSNFEGAEYLHDFNNLINKSSPILNSFDFIFDSGTLEHILHLPNALKNIFLLLKNEGRIYHLVPSSNHMNHGFHMFSPLFFEEYYSANKFDINDMKIIQCGSANNSKWKISKYEPESLERVTNEDFGRRCYMIHCIATKNRDSVADIIPQQKRYSLGVWLERSESEKISTTFEELKDRIRKNRILYPIASSIFNRFRREIFTHRFQSSFKSIDAHCL